MKRYAFAFLFLFLFLFFCNRAGEISTDTANIIFRSSDGGQTWRDIYNGLPEDLQADSIGGNRFFTTDKGLFIRVGNSLYQSKPNAKSPFWAKAYLSAEDSSMAIHKSGIIYWGVHLKKANGTSVWSPIFENFQDPRLRSVFETAGGTIFIGTEKGFFKTVNDGETWKHVHTGNLVGHLAESDNVLVAISMGKIIRSTDDGEHWTLTASEDSMAWDVKPFNGGFVAVTSGTTSNTRRLSTSYDGGKTWQSNHSGFQDKAVIDSIGQTWNNRPQVKAYMTSIIKVGELFFCMHPNGIFSSSDKGKTWKLILAAVKNKVFNLFVAGNVIYAIPGKGGC